MRNYKIFIESDKDFSTMIYSRLINYKKTTDSYCSIRNGNVIVLQKSFSDMLNAITFKFKIMKYVKEIFKHNEYTPDKISFTLTHDNHLTISSTTIIKERIYDTETKKYINIYHK